MYGPRDRLLRCRDASGSVSLQVTIKTFSSITHKVLDKCLEVVVVYISSLLAGCLLNKGARGSSFRQATTPARYDEGTLATNHNAATGRRGYHDTSPP